MTNAWEWQPKVSLALARGCYLISPPGVDSGHGQSFLAKGDELQHFEGWDLLAAPPLQKAVWNTPRVHALFCPLHGGFFVTFLEEDRCHICHPPH